MTNGIHDHTSALDAVIAFATTYELTSDWSVGLIMGLEMSNRYPEWAAQISAYLFERGDDVFTRASGPLLDALAMEAVR